MNLPSISKKYSAKHIYHKDIKLLIVIAISISTSVLLFLIGILIMLDIAVFAYDGIKGMDFMVMGLLTAIGPIGFYNSTKAKRKKEVEEHLPDFLREISSSTSSGMTIYDSIISASNGDHGRLTAELKIMAAQLSWGIPVDEALDNFGKRINTPAVKRIVVTINKALSIGGNTSAVFEAAAKEIDQTKVVEQQRQAEMSMYAIVIFISFFVFLAVILIIDKTIFQAIFDLQGQMPTGEQAQGSMTIAAVDPEEVKNVFFSFVLVQSVGGGLLGGFMMDGKISSGVRFAFILVLVSFFIFKFMF